MAMRIIGGRYRSRRLHSPADALTTRPIPDRVKESVFNLLRGHFEGARVVDCFAGTGSIGLEAVSRGAEQCVFVEQDKRAVEMLEKNIGMLGCGDRCAVVRGDALGAAVMTRIAAMGGVDLVFLDPPYPLVRDAGGGWVRVKSQVERLLGMLSEKGFLVLRTPWPFRHAEVAAAAVVDGQGEDGGAEGREAGRGGHGGSGGRAGKKHRSSRPRLERSWVIGSGGVGDRIDVEAIEEGSKRLERAMRKGKGKGEDEGAGGVGGRRVRLEDEDEEEGEGGDRDVGEMEGAGIGAEEEDAGAVEQPGVTYHEVEMGMAGGVGPETHVYGSTAVHLYMRGK